MQWISLKKQTPPIGEWILALTEGGGIYESRYLGETKDNIGWMVPWYLQEDVKFTHWMPLPEKPNE
jgi:hypothetical protein